MPSLRGCPHTIIYSFREGINWSSRYSTVMWSHASQLSRTLAHMEVLDQPRLHELLMMLRYEEVRIIMKNDNVKKKIEAYNYYYLNY